MKERIINALISCDWWNAGVKSSKEMCPSSSIEEIAEYLAREFSSEYAETAQKIMLNERGAINE